MCLEANYFLWIKTAVSHFQHTSGLWHFDCMLYCFALGCNVSTLMTVQWCKLGEWWSMSCEIFVVVYQLMGHPSGRHFAVNPAPSARWLWPLSIGCRLFLQVSRVCYNWGDVCLLHHFMRCTAHLFMLTHHALRNMASAITVWWHIICITLSCWHLIFSCVQLHLRISYCVCISSHTSRIILSHSFHLIIH